MRAFAKMPETEQRSYLLQRIEERSIPEPMSGCHIWIGTVNKKGYGRLSVAAKERFAHRVVWELVNGPVPGGLFLDHICRNRQCVNPVHLRAVTRRVNTLAGIGPSAQNARKTVCMRGHPFDRDDKRGRWCTICDRTQRYRWWPRARDNRRARRQQAAAAARPQVTP